MRIQSFIQLHFHQLALCPVFQHTNKSGSFPLFPQLVAHPGCGCLALCGSSFSIQNASPHYLCWYRDSLLLLLPLSKVFPSTWLPRVDREWHSSLQLVYTEVKLGFISLIGFIDNFLSPTAFILFSHQEYLIKTIGLIKQSMLWFLFIFVPYFCMTLLKQD